MIKKVVLLTVLIHIVILSNSYSQDTADRKSVNELLNLSLDDFLNVVITPSKLPQSEGNITQKVDVIDNEDIETVTSGNRNICEVISRLPGVSVSVLSRNDANWGTYGGIGPKYSTYMLQGLPVDAFIDPMSLDLNAIDHIEVQRGPASIVYPNYLSQDFAGNQTPLAGTVNLILKTKIENEETSLQLAYGSYNTLNAQIYHQNNYKSLNYFIGATYETSDYVNYGADSSWLNMKKNPEYNKTKIFAGLTFFLKSDQKEKITIYLQKTFHLGDAGRVYRGFGNEYGTLNAGYELAISNKLQLQSHFGIRSYDRSWQESTFGIIDTLKSENGVNQVIIPADLSLTWFQGTKSSLSLGSDYQAATYTTWTDPLLGYHNLGTKASALQAGVYAQEEWHPIEKLTLRGGLRLAYLKNLVDLVTGAAPGNREVSWDRLLWSAGTRYSINKNLSFYTNAGTSFAAPGLKSSSGTISMSEYGIPGHNGQLPNPDLKPESGSGADAGIDLKFKSFLKLGMRFFYSKVDDAIVDNVISQNPSQTKSLNAGSSEAMGGEIEISQKVNSGLSWFANYTFMESNVRNDLYLNQDKVNIPFSPNHVLNLGLNYNSKSGLTLAPQLNYTSGYYDSMDRTTREWFTQGLVVNAYAGQRIAGENSWSVEIFAQFNNIFNNDYELPWQFKNTGFCGMGGIKVIFR